MAKFEINLDDKPSLRGLMNNDTKAFKDIVGTFVNLMELAASKRWDNLPQAIHTSLSFQDVVTGFLNAALTTEEIDPLTYSALESDLHPLAFLSDKRKNLITDEYEGYDWRSHFSVDSSSISKETLEIIIRKLLYLVRWFDVETVSKSLIANQFPIVDDKDIRKLPFQPALTYQAQHLGELYVGKFMHDIGAFNCGPLVDPYDENTCPACKVGDLKYFLVNNTDYHICPRCNAGFTIEG